MQPILSSKKKVQPVVKISGIGLLLLLGFLAYFGSIKEEKALSGYTSSNIFGNTTLLPPVFSHSAGFYENTFSLKMEASPGTKVFYTLDGSKPGLGSSLYEGPIEISNQGPGLEPISLIRTSPRWKPPVGKGPVATVVRAVAVSKTGTLSGELVQTYFILPLDLKQFNLPVVSLVAEKEGFFDFKRGIYVMGKGYEDKDNYVKKHVKLDAKWWDYPANYKRRGENWERPVHVEYFKEDGTKLFAIKAGARINGQATRAFSQKSLRLVFENALQAKVFPGKGEENYQALVLRNSGNDWDRTLFRDALMHSVLENTPLDLQAYQPVIVFLNGEYWGIHNLREKQDKHYLSEKYQVHPDSIRILETSLKSFAKNNVEDYHYRQLLTYLTENALEDEKAYQKAGEMMDLENFMEYVIANVYFANSDWPRNNVKCWRKDIAYGSGGEAKGHDGKWRWMVFDLDYGFGYTGMPQAAQVNMIEMVLNSNTDIGIILKNLMKNAGFRRAFKQRYLEMLHKDFEPGHVKVLIEEMKSRLEPEMEAHINRWRYPGSIKQWEKNVGVLRDFAEKRWHHQVQMVEQFEN